jgi:deoxycytidine triphosphate deaminase
MNIDFSIFPRDDEDAADRAKTFVDRDPLPSVPCSLLSSAEIHDYARITAMLSPFFPDALKSASYEAHVGGEFIWWDGQGLKHESVIKRGDPCILPANSITFVQVEPIFRLPNYIAIRFNLRITHVHRGLLLGTGPLVDPGFEGKLLIPLHNLTSSQYDLNTSEALIWIEFTKTTYGHRPVEAIAARQGTFARFPDDKKNKTPDYYLRKANAGNPIRSSIPDALEQGKRDAANSANSAQAAATTATQIQERVTRLGLLAFAALLVALLGLYTQVAGMVENSNALSVSVKEALTPLAAENSATAEKLNFTQAEVTRIRQQVDQFGAAQSEIDWLTRQVDELNRELSLLKQVPPAPPQSKQKARGQK